MSPYFFFQSDDGLFVKNVLQTSKLRGVEITTNRAQKQMNLN